MILSRIELLPRLEERPRRRNVGVPSQDKENISPVVSDFTGHQAIFEDFVRAIQENGTPLCDGRKGGVASHLLSRFTVRAKRHA